MDRTEFCERLAQVSLGISHRTRDLPAAVQNTAFGPSYRQLSDLAAMFLLMISFFHHIFRVETQIYSVKILKIVYNGLNITT